MNPLNRTLIIAFLFICVPVFAYTQATCLTATSLTPSTSCSNPAVQPNLQNALSAGFAGTCSGATTTTYSVWYKFIATSTTSTITVGNLGSNLSSSTTYMEVLTGVCGLQTSIACQTVATRLTLSTTIGSVYYIRVYVLSNPTGNPTSKWNFDICVQTPPANDDCSGAVSLTSNTSCSNVSGTLDLATASSGLPSGCESAGTHYDVWYKFTASSTIQTITLSNLGANLTNPEIQLYSGTCGSLTSLQCGTTSLTASGLTVSNTYYIRVSNVGSNPSGTSNVADFNICVTHASTPANDDCSGAVTLTPATSCSNTSGTLNGATATTGLPSGCESGGTHYDVWYKFTAARTYELILLSSLGTNISNPELQLYSGTCGTLTSIQCGTTSITASSLSIGTTYYLRISNVGSAMTSNGSFSICVYHPNPSTYDYGKSYINISRNSGGGTINVGDTLEIRATLVIRNSGSVLDSLAFFDTLYNSGGTRLIPGSIALRTNEGKVYKSFTDASGDDAGYRYTNGLDTVIRMNIGSGASSSARGRLLNTSKPSVFGASCIIMATYRVVVYAAYNSLINVGGGAFSIKDANTGISGTLSLSSRSAMVYSSPGLCPNAVSATNAIGGDFNGTFGTPSGSAPLARNRGTSTNVLSYIYNAFSSAGGPNDYYYGIANNTSQSFSTTTTWPKSDPSSPTHRVFNVWDITGDHTGAINTTKGNPPCDTTQPMSATNPCGYMLVINSAYKTDTAFQYSVTNLCPNTYYEVSAWLKNICYKCSCDSNGTGVSGAGYIPFALNDSSGVQPNLAFDINGIDYYTTGNIAYAGIYPATQTGSDSTNKWVKRGFTYLTGTSQSSLTLTIRNNAPGGGGNDWALDDISLATCLPNMSYSPSLAPAVCDSNTISINDTIRSYFNNYANYKWQRSTNNGSTWNDIAGASGVASPAWNGSAYQYISSYTVPPAATNLTDNGNMYRVVVATTSSNLSSSSCQTTDGISIITLSVIDCGIVLNTDMLSLNGRLISNHSQLLWSTSKENESVIYDIEKSFDGINFNKIGSINGYNDNKSEVNHYSFRDPFIFSGKGWYRIVIRNNNSGRKYSQTIRLSDQQIGFGLGNIINPFRNALSFEVTATYNTKIDVILTDLFGKTVKQKSYNIYSGVNGLTIDNTQGLSPGIYALQVKNGNTTINSKVLKR